MRTTLHIAIQTLRSILRERVALSMIVLLALVWLLLPTTLEGDGTIEGDLRMLIRYTLGFSVILLAGMTVWVSCAAIATDLSSKRLQMVLTKPVSRGHIWWGKWLAITTLVSSLLLLSTFVTALRVHHRLHQADLSEADRNHIQETLITARRPVPPLKEDLIPDAKSLLEQQARAGLHLPDYLTEQELIQRAVQHVTSIRYSVQGGSQTSWTFNLPKPVSPGERLQLGLRLDGGSMVIETVKGTWTFTTPDSEQQYSVEVDHAPQGIYNLILDHKGLLDGATTITATFTLNATPDHAIFYEPDHGVRLFRSGGSFALNLLRSSLLLSGLLSLLAALGLSAGSLFSLPVACYATFVLLLTQAFSNVIAEVIEESPDYIARASGIMPLLLHIRAFIFKGLQLMLKPIELGRPLERLAGGESIPVDELFNTLMFRFTPVLLIIAIPAVLLFRKREIGVAS